MLLLAFWPDRAWASLSTRCNIGIDSSMLLLDVSQCACASATEPKFMCSSSSSSFNSHDYSQFSPLSHQCRAPSPVSLFPVQVPETLGQLNCPEWRTALRVCCSILVWFYAPSSVRQSPPTCCLLLLPLGQSNRWCWTNAIEPWDWDQGQVSGNEHGDGNVRRGINNCNQFCAYACRDDFNGNVPPWTVNGKRSFQNNRWKSMNSRIKLNYPHCLSALSLRSTAERNKKGQTEISFLPAIDWALIAMYQMQEIELKNLNDFEPISVA